MCASCAWIVFSCLMRVSSDLMRPSVFVIVLVFGFGFGARIVAMTLLGIAEKDVERLFGREVVVFGFVRVPDFWPASWFHIFHTHRIAPNRQKARFIFAISETIFVDVFANERLNFAL